MNSKLFFVLTVIFAFNLAYAQPKESRCRLAHPTEYTTLGDCHWYGVVYEKDKEKAKEYYLHAAMNHMTEGGEYGKLRAIRTLLFESDLPLENTMRLYLAKDFSDREDVIKTKDPRYDGDYTRRGSARYMLSAYLARHDKTNGAKFYLKKALEDNNGRAAYALYYLNETEKLSPPLTAEEAEALMNEGIQKQKNIFIGKTRVIRAGCKAKLTVMQKI